MLKMPASAPVRSMRSFPSFWRQQHQIDERADLLHRSCAIVRIGKRLLQRGHLLPIELGKIGVEQVLRLGCAGDLPLQLLLPPFQRQELVFKAPCRHALGDRLDDPPDALLGCCPFLLQLLGDLALGQGHDRDAGKDGCQVWASGIAGTGSFCSVSSNLRARYSAHLRGT
jgi:hypothetical protein